MRSRAIQIEFGIRLVIDQQPIRLNVAFPMRDIAARQAVVLILGLKCRRDCQHVDDLLQQVHVVMPLLAYLQVLFEPGGVFYFKHFRPPATN